MKRHFIVSIVILIVALLGFSFLESDPNADKSPNVSSEYVNYQTDTIPPVAFPYPTVFNFNYSAIGGMNGGTVGALWVNGKYYFNRWNSTLVYRYNDNGPGGGPGTLADSLTYAGSIRDLSTDGFWVYGGNASTGVLRFDPNTMATVKTFNLAGGQTRAIAWDPNRKGFWNSAFGGNIFFHDTNGVLRQTITSTLAGKYGLAFDSSSTPGQAFVWAWDQTTTATNGLYKYNAQTGALVASYIFTLTGTQIGTAGGFEIVQKGTQLLALANYQNFALVGYKMAELAPPPYGWMEQTSPVTTALYSVSAPSNSVAWACGAAGKVIRTTNGGTTWTNVSGTIPATGDCYNIFAWDANTALVTASPTAGTYIYKTTNGGTNWTQTFFLAGAFGDALWMSDATTAYFMGDPIGGNWLLKKSTDAGSTWTDWATVPTTITGGWNNSFYMLGSQVWFGTNTASLMYSSNMGANWTTQTTPFTNQYSVWFNNATNGLAGYTALASTTNSGTNWATLTSPVATATAGIAGMDNKWWVATQSASVYYTSNNGANWTTQYTAPALGGVFYHINKSRSGDYLWGVRSLGGISRYGLVSGVNPISVNVPDNYNLSQNYPNPFNPTTKINFSLPKNGFVSMKIYDMLGKEVATLVNDDLKAGSYTVDFNGSNLSSGVYFYKITTNGFSQVKRMALIK